MIRKVNNENFPTLRPMKYPFMMHAEQNAIFNAARLGVSTDNSTAYITGKPCLSCLQYMWQSGINKIVYSDYNDPVMMQNDEYRNNYEFIVREIQAVSDFQEVFIPQKDLLYNVTIWRTEDELGKISKLEQ